MAAGALLGIGLLRRLEILDPATQRVRSVTVRGKWLGWDPKRKAFHVCSARTSRVNPRGVPAGVGAAHRRFHKAASRGALEVEVPEADGATPVGLLKALVYTVPSQVKSPGKNPYQWHHAFGDTGHKGGDRYPQSVMPALLRDRKGNWFIRRRPGNIFTVDEWLRG
jgi:hypothetical protein